MTELADTLYALDVTGRVRTWRVEVSGPRYRTVSGLEGGAEVTSGWTTAEPKNVGRSNATTAEGQALAEATSLRQRRLDRKYVPSRAQLGTSKFRDPMLAQKFKRWTGPCYSQPKLDGVRCVASSSGLLSRGGKPLWLPHVSGALRPLFEADPGLILDGELYNHDYRDDFNSIVSAVKRVTRDMVEEARCREVVQYHVYDVPSHIGNFSERDDYLRRLLSGLSHDLVNLVPTYLCSDAEELDEHYAACLRMGYEGQMVRLDLPYECRRSKRLLKRKEFLDEEFELVAVQEGRGNWAGYAKSATLRQKDGSEFSAGLRGGQALARELLETWQKYSWVTVRFQRRTPDGVPRFGVVTAWHEKLEDRL